MEVNMLEFREKVKKLLVTIVPLPLLACYSAVASGLDPDKPRNLVKSVTVK
jgi:glucosamine--fructose-6-phosphate aminotransferase (isomerizing)